MSTLFPSAKHPLEAVASAVTPAAPAPAVSHPAVTTAPANPWRPLSPCTPDACVRDPASEVGRVWQVARLLVAVLVVLAGVPLALAAARAGTSRLARELTCRWARLLLRALGIRLEVIGTVETSAETTATPATEGTLVVANHISWLDPLVIAATLPSRPLAKHEIATWPVISTLVKGSGALFIDRERLMALPSAVAAVADALRAGDTVIAFPEGTTWCGNGMGGFRPAVFQAAIDAAARIQPATLRYREGQETSTRASFVGEDSLLASALRVAATRGMVAEVKLLAPVRHAPTAPRPRARAELARISETRVRAGVPGRHAPAPGSEGV